MIQQVVPYPFYVLNTTTGSITTVYQISCNKQGIPFCIIDRLQPQPMSYFYGSSYIVKISCTNGSESMFEHSFDLFTFLYHSIISDAFILFNIELAFQQSLEWISHKQIMFVLHDTNCQIRYRSPCKTMLDVQTDDLLKLTFAQPNNEHCCSICCENSYSLWWCTSKNQLALVDDLMFHIKQLNEQDLVAQTVGSPDCSPICMKCYVSCCQNVKQLPITCFRLDERQVKTALSHRALRYIFDATQTPYPIQFRYFESNLFPYVTFYNKTRGLNCYLSVRELEKGTVVNHFCTVCCQETDTIDRCQYCEFVHQAHLYNPYITENGVPLQNVDITEAHVLQRCISIIQCDKLYIECVQCHTLLERATECNCITHCGREYCNVTGRIGFPQSIDPVHWCAMDYEFHPNTVDNQIEQQEQRNRFTSWTLKDWIHYWIITSRESLPAFEKQVPRFWNDYYWKLYYGIHYECLENDCHDENQTCCIATHQLALKQIEKVRKLKHLQSLLYSVSDQLRVSVASILLNNSIIVNPNCYKI